MRINAAQLDVNGEIVASPRESDISAGVERAARQAGGHIRVTRSGGFFIEAAPSDEGSSGLLSLACGDEQKGQLQYATAPVTRAEATVLLKDFLDGGDAWRRQCRWRSRDSQAAASTGRTLKLSFRSFGGWLVGGAAIAFPLVIVVVPPLLPAALVLALCLFVAWKAWREASVRRWPQATARITASALQPRRRRFRQEATTVDNIPALAYEFSVSGRRYTGSRLGLNTEYAGVDVGALVARYPVGAMVPVYYKPSDPNDCLLDPFANRGLAGDVLKLLAILGTLCAALYYSASVVTHAVAAHFPNANARHVVWAASGALLFLLLFAWSFRPRPRTTSLRAPGVIVKSEVEEISWPTAGNNLLGGAFMQPTIEVAYSVRGQDYVLRTGVGAGTGANTREAAQARLVPYPVGKTVNVLYGPDNPGASSLEGNQFTINPDPTQTGYRVAAVACAFVCGVIATIALGVL